jgi:hypothetical protein
VIDSDPVEPGAELTLASECAQLGHYLDENLLGSVLRNFTVPKHPDGDIVNPRLMAPHQFVERILLPGLRPGNEVFVGGFASRRCYRTERIGAIASGFTARKLVQTVHIYRT